MSDREQLSAIGQTNLARTRIEQDIALKLRDLGPIEIEIIEEIVDRLAFGQKQYGKFPADDARDFAKEAKEEALDLAIYLARRVIK